MFHPDLFKISRCIRGPDSTECERGDFCAFAHSEEDLRSPSFLKDNKTSNNTNGSLGFHSFLSDDEQQNHSLLPLSPHKGVTTSDGLSPFKPLTVDSAALDVIQCNLVALIKSQGIDGIARAGLGEGRGQI